jgi:membrane-bound ClpP family serine protease
VGYTLSAFVGALSLSYGLFGLSNIRINSLMRVMFFSGGFLLLFPDHLLSGIGFLLVASAFLIERGIKRSENRKTTGSTEG